MALMFLPNFSRSVRIWQENILSGQITESFAWQETDGQEMFTCPSVCPATET